MTLTKKEQTINNIISATKRLYKKYAYEGTTMQMIADEAGISKSLLTHYFQQKHLLLTTITKRYLDDIGEFISAKYPDDPLLIMMMTYKIFFRNILNDPETKAFWSGSALRTDRGMDSYNNSDSIYVPVLEQFNPMMGENESMIRKIQILGANTELSYVYFNQICEIDDDDYINQQLFTISMFLGASNLSILNCILKSDELLDTIDYSSFKLLD